MATRKQFFSGHGSQFTSLRCNPAPAFTVNVSEACETLWDQRLPYLCSGSVTDDARLLDNLFDFLSSFNSLSRENRR